LISFSFSASREDEKKSSSSFRLYKKGDSIFFLRYKLGIVFVYVIIKTNVFLKKKNFREFTVRKA